MPIILNVDENNDNAKGSNVDELLDLAIGESAANHTAMMAETKANAESAHSIVRHTGAQKFQREDPIEAAAAEMILQKVAG